MRLFGKKFSKSVISGELPRDVCTDAKKSKSIPAGKERILIVDDEQDLIEVMHEMLECVGYDVVGKTDPVDALKTFRDDPDAFDLVITDKIMPQLNGFELVKAIKAIKPEKPIIICTGFCETNDLDIIKNMGIDRLLTKPIALNELVKTVQNVLAHRGSPGIQI